MSGYLIKDTTKEERIALIRSWQEPDDCVGGSGMDLFDMYDAYIRGEKEIAEINGEFQASYVKDTEDLEQPEEAKSTSGELTQLTKLHAEGALTDEEFAAAKKKRAWTVAHNNFIIKTAGQYFCAILLVTYEKTLVLH